MSEYRLNSQLEGVHGNSASNILFSPQGLSHISKKSRKTPEQNQSYFQEIQRILQGYANQIQDSIKPQVQVSQFDLQNVSESIKKRKSSVFQDSTKMIQNMPKKHKQKGFSARNKNSVFNQKLFEIVDSDVDNASPDFLINKINKKFPPKERLLFTDPSRIKLTPSKSELKSSSRKKIMIPKRYFLRAVNANKENCHENVNFESKAPKSFIHKAVTEMKMPKQEETKPAEIDFCMSRNLGLAQKRSLTEQKNYKPKIEIKLKVKLKKKLKKSATSQMKNMINCEITDVEDLHFLKVYVNQKQIDIRNQENRKQRQLSSEKAFEPNIFESPMKNEQRRNRLQSKSVRKERKELRIFR